MEIETQKKHSYLDEYKILKTLGAGYHAQVKLGSDDEGNLVAIKKYKKETATLDTLKHQLSIMQALSHQNLVKLISVRQNAIYKKGDETTYKCFSIVLEYVGGGELFDFIAETGKFSQRIARTYFHQMMNGLYYMHGKGYAHRDIKPENILLSHAFILKLADFGFSCFLKGKEGTGVLKTKLGTEGYMAPQIPQKKYDGKKVDIFAAGVILFIMYAGNPPFQKATPNDPYYKILIQKKYQIFWKAHSRKRPIGYFSDNFKDLFIRLVAYVPQQRLTIEQIATHPWVKDAVCTHQEIKQQFKRRQQKLDQVLQQKRIQQQKQKASKMTAITNQNCPSTRGQAEVEVQFLQIYNDQKHHQRKLPLLQFNTINDIVIKDGVALSISLLKQFLKRHQIKLADQEEDQLMPDSKDKLKVCQVEDQSEHKLLINYQYTYQIDQQEFNQNVSIQAEIGTNPQQQVVMRFERIDGNQLYFKKIMKDIKTQVFGL